MMHKRRSRRNSKKFRKTLLTVAMILLPVLILLFVGTWIDSEQFELPEDALTSDPYIELSPFDGEQYLVGDVVVEWLKGETSGEELYNTFSSRGRVYTANPVTLRYTIHDLPPTVEVISQLVKLSEDASFREVKSFDLTGNKRSISFEHLYTNRTYYYQITARLSDGREISADGQFQTADTPRIISTEGVWNMRDIGGAKTSNGSTTVQGLVYRGVELDGAVYDRYCITAGGAKVLTRELGIKSELDLRAPSEEIRDMLGADVNHTVYGTLAYSDSLIPHYLDSYRELFSDLANEEIYPVYIHCTYGKDRTGTVCFLLQLLLGVSVEDAYKEWELSVLFDGRMDYSLMDDYIAALEKLEGATMQEKVENHLLSIGVTKAEIESIRSILIEGYVPDYSESEEEPNVWKNKKIVYDGDSIAMGLYGDGGYAQIIAEQTGSKMENFSIGGGSLDCPQIRRGLSFCC